MTSRIDDFRKVLEWTIHAALIKEFPPGTIVTQKVRTSMQNVVQKAVSPFMPKTALLMEKGPAIEIKFKPGTIPSIRYFSRLAICQDCAGTGTFMVADDGPEECLFCDGRGVVAATVDLDDEE